MRKAKGKVQKAKGIGSTAQSPNLSIPQSPIPNPQSSTLLRSFRYATQGILHTFRTQRNARIEAGIAGIVVVLGVWLQINLTQWAVLVGCMGLVLGLEILNTGVEALVDLVSPERHPLAKVAKDAAAGAVLWAAILSVIVGVLVLGPGLWEVVVDWLIG